MRRALITVMLLTICHHFTSATVMDTSHALKARQKRFLIYQEGINWVQMVVGIGFPVELRKESVTWGATLKSYYLLPTNSSDILRPSLNIERRKRSLSRWEMYSSVRDFIDRFNLGNGKACILRAVCEAALAPFEEKSGLLAEVMHVVLSPSSTNEDVKDYTDWEYHSAEKKGKNFDDCSAIFSECNNYFLEQFFRLLL